MVITLLQHIAYVDCCKSVITIFYFCCFRCVIVPLTGVINYVFCIYICCFIANFCHRTRLGSTHCPVQ